MQHKFNKLNFSSGFMKKEVLSVLLLIFLFSASIVIAAPEIKFQTENSTFQPGETILGEITTPGYFSKQIQLNDVQFFKARKQVFFDYDLVYYNNTYYFYIIPNFEGDFSMRVNNILYKNPDLQSSTIEKQFSVKTKFIDENKTQTQILSINPGFVYTSNDPELILKNKGNTQINLTYSQGESKNELSITPENFRIIYPQINKTFSYLSIESYEKFNIPVIYISLTTQNTNQTIPSIEPKLKPDPSILSVSIVTGQEKQETIELVNFGETNITNITITSNISILTSAQLDFIEAKSIKNITLNFSSQSDGFIGGDIVIAYFQDNLSQRVIIPTNIYIYPQNTSTENQTIIKESCSELGGIVCSSGEICLGEQKFTAYEEYCCLSSCELFNPTPPGGESPGKSYGWMWGIIILIVLGAVGYFAYKKYKQTKPKKPEDLLQEKTKLYETRIQGGLTRT